MKDTVDNMIVPMNDKLVINILEDVRKIAAVDAVRKKNQASIENTVKLFTEMEKNYQKVQEETVQLKNEIAVLLPQRNEIQKNYESLLLDHNKQLAHKSDLQIIMNETSTKITSRNQEMIQIEADTVELKKLQIEIREETKKKIEEYQKEIEIIKKDFEKVASKEEETKREHDKIMEEMTACDIEYQRLYDCQEALQNKTKSQKKENHKLQLELDAMIKQEKELITEKKKLHHQELELTEKHNQDINNENKIINELKMKSVIEKRRTSELKHQIKDKQEAVITGTEKVTQLEEELKKVETEFKIKDDEYKSKSLILRGLKSTNKKLREEIERIKAENSLREAKFNEEIRKNKKSLEDQMQLKKMAEKQCKDLQNQAELIQAQTKEYAAEKERNITNLKEQCTAKSQEVENLEESIKELDQTIQTLEKEIELEEAKFDATVDKNTEKFKETEKMISELEETRKKQNDLMEKKKPDFEEMQRLFQQEEDSFNKSRDEFIASRRTDIALTNDIKKQEEYLKEIKASLNEVSGKNKELQAEYLKMLESDSQESVELEEEIHVQSCKLKILLEENFKLKQDILAKERESENVKMTNEKLGEEFLLLQKEISNNKAQLFQDLETMERMRKAAEHRDQMTIEQMDTFENIIHSNIQILDNASKQLSDQLETVNVYLNEGKPSDTH
ncbi:golgin subfamily A member 4-like [Argonauta hians]